MKEEKTNRQWRKKRCPYCHKKRNKLHKCSSLTKEKKRRNKQ